MKQKRQDILLLQFSPNCCCADIFSKYVYLCCDVLDIMCAGLEGGKERRRRGEGKGEGVGKERRRRGEEEG